MAQLKRSMIFHVAYTLNPNASSASGIRPVRMREAFESIGFEVHEVSGSHAERKAKIDGLKRRIRGGEQFEFVYSESSTAPVAVGQPVSRFASRTRDIGFLKFCQRAGINVGVFYRDIYWRFPIYTEAVKWPLSAILRACFRQDLRRYSRAGVTIYLPSIEMAKWVPIIPPSRFAELPPGGERRDTGNPKLEPGRVRILYVGGLGENYRLHETVRAVSGMPGVSLTICTREREWEARRSEYEPFMERNIRVVHRSGAELNALYEAADVCILAVEPIEYWEFAVPVKLFEYLSHGKPVIASKGSYSARFVRENRVGWDVAYGSTELKELLNGLCAEPEPLLAAQKRVLEARAEHTWEGRAQQVATSLANSSQDLLEG